MAWSLKLAAWSLRLEAFKKLLAALQVRSWQLVMWPDKIPGQVVVFNSFFHVILSVLPGVLYCASSRLMYKTSGLI